ncbi:AAA family ATPase [Cryptosporangium aurantiacum]|uniref:Nuclease SbcCD subunit C n=1 Tax=Cryptosporangium aurantiacum TaxID=134849 RepID=A0A1M7RNU3_9ACTN|nr:AAA family ATPase [Cryptosporangium aurantiacum]SHN47889.1 AAA domain-containing protein [Cryptosporangium aurantiacum]
MDREHVLLDALFDRLTTDDVADRTADLVLAAYAGEDELRAVLAGERVELPERPAADAEQAAVYLRSITVAGFRGVGPKAELMLRPEPGLTLIVGRNGSGKSSFAEAVELALTGGSARLAERSGTFRSGWRNLHVPSPGLIELNALVDGDARPIRIRRTWGEDETAPEEAAVEVRHGADRYDGTAALGWQRPLEVYRPFLTADDLGRLIAARPSDLFDALAPLLGIEPVTAADERLKAVRRELTARQNAVRDGKKELLALLAASTDERAREAERLLARPRPDRAGIDALLARADDVDEPGVAAARRLLAAPPLPGAEYAEDVASALESAAGRVAGGTGPETERVEQLAGLLRLAVGRHAAHGDEDCPVCRTGRLDADWAAEARHRLEQADRAVAGAREAAKSLADARRKARDLLARVRAVLPDGPGGPNGTRGPGDPGAAGGSDGWGGLVGLEGVPAEVRAGLLDALVRWRTVDPDDDPLRLASELRLQYPGLRDAVDRTTDAVAAWLRDRHDAWRGPAAALQQWLTAADEAAAAKQPLTELKAAIEWLRGAIGELRAARLAPFAERSQQIWQALRQESNVELAGMTLDGSSTRRRVSFPAAVDGAAAPALAVMSQGELQALGLAVFLPRAVATESPFRFLVVDDPVQSMDPAKVDGLARVLAGLAAHRQVVVFTHDDRLPEAVRRLGLGGRILEVTRRENSRIEIRANHDPVDRYLDDARALARTDELTEDVRGPVVAALCRSAVEAACHEQVRRVRIDRGQPHRDVDAVLGAAGPTTQVAALALFDDPAAGGRVLPRLNRAGGWAADAFRACKEGTHGRYSGDLPKLVADTTRLTALLRGRK